jgi:hypothetical protein
MRTIRILIFLNSISFFSIGQEKTLYLDSCENYVGDSSYSMKRIVLDHPDKKFTYIFKDFYKNGVMLTSGIAKARNGKTKDGDFIFFHDNSKQLAIGQLAKDSKKGNWTYFDINGIEVTKDELVNKMPTTKFIKDGISFKGKCLCYKKEGIWEEENLKTKIKTFNHYEDDQPITIDGVYTIIDDTASYKGGMVEFYKYMSRELKYPFITRLKGKQGKVFVRFTVDEQGEVNSPDFLQTLDKRTEKKILNVLMSTSGRWDPATYKGKKVKSRLILPVYFELK